MIILTAILVYTLLGLIHTSIIIHGGWVINVKELWMFTFLWWYVIISTVVKKRRLKKRKVA